MEKELYQILKMVKDEIDNRQDYEKILVNVSYLNNLVNIIQQLEDSLVKIDADSICRDVEIGGLREEIESLTERFHKQTALIVEQDAKLVRQQEEIEALRKVIDILQLTDEDFHKEIAEKRTVKRIIAKILAYVEKNCVEVEDVEEYLWRLLDEGMEFE